MIEHTATSRPRTTYILGAGFSKAVSPSMPVTDELGRQAIATLAWADTADVPSFSPTGINFESWLTWLSERQPYLSEAEHLRDRARFAELSTALAHVLRDAQRRASEASSPAWLSEFVDVAHWAQSDVITLNYDTIIEEEVQRGRRFDGESVVRADDVVTGIPNSRGVFQGKATDFVDRDTLHLHKLHGSVDWFSVPGDATGTTLDRIDIPAEAPTRADQARIGGREVFIVPPTSSKGGYFDSPRTRFVWQQAREALVAAERVVLIGYSLPLTDTALARLLATTLSDGVQNIVVVNPDAAGVKKRLNALGIDDTRLHVFEGWDCAEEFVASEVNALSAVVAQELFADAATSPDRPIAVGWNDRWGAVTESHLNADGTLVLTIDEASHQLALVQHPGNATPPEWSRPTLTLGDVLKDATPSRVVMRWNGQDWPVAARVVPSYEVEEDWVLLRPAGRHPNPHG